MQTEKSGFLRQSKHGMASQISVARHVSSFRNNLKTSLAESRRLQEVFKAEPEDFKKMLYFFRYHLISLL